MTSSFHELHNSPPASVSYTSMNLLPPINCNGIPFHGATPARAPPEAFASNSSSPDVGKLA